VNAIEALPDDAFEDGSALEQSLGETVHGVFANNTYEHYPIHEGQLRAYAERIQG
jgi:hypothetical protein